MTEEDVTKSWWGAPTSEFWICPECNSTSAVPAWSQRDIYCEDCGDHDGRFCPMCGTGFDHVWGVKSIIEANALGAKP